MGIAESQITGIQTDPCSQYMILTQATHDTVVYLHVVTCGAPRDKVDWPATDVPPHLKKRLALMNHHRDLVGECEWTAVDCEKKSAPDPVLTGVAEHT
jgi:hypothetical protein